MKLEAHWQFLLASIIAIMSLVAVLMGVCVLDRIATRDAQIAELEFQIADLWTEKEHCKHQLGVFYMPETTKGEK